MKKFFSVLLAGIFLTSTVYGAGITKTEYPSTDAGSVVLYGTSDSGDSIVRVKTDADGTLNATISGTYTGPLSVSQNSDTVEISHDGTDAYMKWSDGYLRLETDEGTNTDTYVWAKGKGTGSGFYVFRDGSNAQYYSILGQVNTVASMRYGTGVTEFAFNEDGADVDFRVESDTQPNAFVVDGETGDVRGNNTAIAKQHDEIGILLDNLTAPVAIIGFTGTGADTATESGYENGAGRVWTYSGGLATDKIFKGQTYVYSFDGTDSYLSTPDTADMSFGDGSNDSAFSVGGWVQVVDTATVDVIVAKYAGSNREYFVAKDAAEKIYISQWDESVGVEVKRTTDAAVSAGWHFIVITQSGTGGATAMNTAAIYVDGVVVASTAANNGNYVAMENLTAVPTIGQLGTSANWFTGDMGRLFVTAEELSAATVWKLYEKTRGFYNE